MNKIIVTGSGGLVGRETCEFFLKKGFQVIGIDNNMREYFFGKDANILSNVDSLLLLKNYIHETADIRNYSELEIIFKKYSSDIKGIIHCASQPSHDWAVKNPILDFNTNATGTLNLLELTRLHCKDSVFIFMSTSKVYGDRPNLLPFIETPTRWELEKTHPLFEGIKEDFSIDQSKHSLFGCSKISADVYVQEYGKYFGMKTTVFRGGCLTGSKHKGAELHGFLNYLVKCGLNNIKYKIFGYKGKQVRDNIHSFDLVSAFYEVFLNSKNGEVYNIGGGRYSNCSIIEAIDIIEGLTGNKLETEYVEPNRIGDHIWWIDDVSKFKSHYPNWKYTYSLTDIIKEIIKNIQK